MFHEAVEAHFLTVFVEDACKLLDDFSLVIKRYIELIIRRLLVIVGPDVNTVRCIFVTQGRIRTVCVAIDVKEHDHELFLQIQHARQPVYI